MPDPLARENKGRGRSSPSVECPVGKSLNAKDPEKGEAAAKELAGEGIDL